jgi:hypothetical protein
LKLKQKKFHKFQNARPARTGRNIVKSSRHTRPLLDSSSFAPVLTLPPPNLPPFCF